MEGTVIETPQKLKDLLHAAPNMGAWAKEFTASVSAQFAEKGTLTEKQWAWVDKLLSEQAMPKPEAVDGTGSLPIELNQQAVENPDYTPPETVAQTHLEEPASQPPVTEPEVAPAPSQAPVRVEFDCKPGVAVKNLMEALNAK
jgi:hypothetical protein